MKSVHRSLWVSKFRYLVHVQLWGRKGGIQGVGGGNKKEREHMEELVTDYYRHYAQFLNHDLIT
jgi:hypothetical protein